MSATPYGTLVARIRPEARDPATGTAIFQETPQGTRDGTNTLFRLQNKNIVSTSVYYTYGTSSIRATTGFTLTDSVNGYITITTAPDNNTTFPFFFDYNFLYFADSDYNTWIDTATEELGVAAGTAVAESLYGALICYVLSKYWTARASEYAIRFASSAGGASESISTVAAEFRALAKAALDKGRKLRDDYYTSFGQKLKPSSWTITHGISPIAPRR